MVQGSVASGERSMRRCSLAPGCSNGAAHVSSGQGTRPARKREGQLISTTYPARLAFACCRCSKQFGRHALAGSSTRTSRCGPLAGRVEGHRWQVYHLRSWCPRCLDISLRAPAIRQASDRFCGRSAALGPHANACITYVHRLAVVRGKAVSIICCVGAQWLAARNVVQSLVSAS
jgi:hypothetical protein